MKNSILVVFSFGGFNPVMSHWHFFFFKLFEIAHELAKLQKWHLYYQQSFQHFNSFSIIIRIPRTELLRIPTCILLSKLSIEMTCLEKRLKDPNLRWVLSSMSWKFARIILGRLLFFQDFVYYGPLGAVAYTEQSSSFLIRGEEQCHLRAKPRKWTFRFSFSDNHSSLEKNFFVHLVFLEIYWPPFLNRRDSLFPIGVSRVSVSLINLITHEGKDKDTHFGSVTVHWVEPRYNEPLYNEDLGITNDFLYPSNIKIYEKGPRYNETSL